MLAGNVSRRLLLTNQLTMLIRNLLLPVAVVCLLSLYATVSAESYYVSPLGDDANSGTSEDQPFQMVQHAIDQMSSGDTLVVLDGVYTGALKLKSGISIRAKNRRKVVFSGADRLQGIFEKHSENIYKINVGIEPKHVFYKTNR